MERVLSTVELQAETQFSEFRRSVCREIATLSVEQIGVGPFHAKIGKMRAGNFSFTDIECDPVLIERSEMGIRQDGESCYFVTLQRIGVGRIRQMGREVELHPGDFALVDSTIPYLIEFNEPVNRLVAAFPRNEFKRRGCASEVFCGRAFGGSTGAGKVASKLLNILWESNSDFDAGLGMSLSAAILDAIVISELKDAPVSIITQSHSQAELLRRARVFVMANIADPDLSPQRVADESGISVRYLHKIFASTGISLSRWIQKERLERCYHQLANSRHRHRSVQSIAFSNGFNDSGYFSNRFFREYGMTPSQARIAAKSQNS